MPASLSRALSAAAAALMLPAALAACSSEEPAPAEPTTQDTAAPAEETTPTSKNKRRDPEMVDEVRERFSTLAPASLFDALDTCTETSLKGSFECNGAEVGSFQFFESESMAEDTADVLTGLVSSRVVSETEDKVVGWSMLGKTALITVVDTDKGQVLQQMISSEQDDPEQHIYKLGLAEDDGSGVTTPTPENTSTETDENQEEEQPES